LTDTQETRYNALHYNANWVIMQLQSWFPIFDFFRDLHPARVWTAGRDAWRSKTCRPVAIDPQWVTLSFAETKVWDLAKSKVTLSFGLRLESQTKLCAETKVSDQSLVW